MDQIILLWKIQVEFREEKSEKIAISIAPDNKLVSATSLCFVGALEM